MNKYQSALLELDKYIVAKLVDLIFKTGTIRLDFRDGTNYHFGDNTYPYVAISAPSAIDMLILLMHPSMRLGEFYVDKKINITSGDLADLIHLSQLQTMSPYGKIYQSSRRFRSFSFFGKQLLMTRYFTRKVRSHYNIDVNFFIKVLDESMTYSCAFFSDCFNNLSSAQINKHNTILDRLEINNQNLKILDIGCGWGGFAKFLDGKVQCDFTGISISNSQIDYCKKTFDHRKSFNFIASDYIEYAKSHANMYDRIVSIGMFEHVGLGHHAKFFDAVEKMLVPGGLAVIHTIVRPEPGRVNEWVEKNIFPGGYAPSLAEFVSAAECSNIRIRDIFIHRGENYKKTVQCWYDRFIEAVNKGELSCYSEKFLRTWEFYMAVAKAMFEDTGLGYQVAQLKIEKLRK